MYKYLEIHDITNMISVTVTSLSVVELSKNGGHNHWVYADFIFASYSFKAGILSSSDTIKNNSQVLFL